MSPCSALIPAPSGTHPRQPELSEKLDFLFPPPLRTGVTKVGSRAAG